MIKWEYCKIWELANSGTIVRLDYLNGTTQQFPKDSFGKLINSLGQEGWELINIVCTTTGSSAVHMYFFKRPL